MLVNIVPHVLVRNDLFISLSLQVDANQELAAMGISNIFGSFFQSLPVAASMARFVPLQ